MQITISQLLDGRISEHMTTKVIKALLCTPIDLLKQQVTNLCSAGLRFNILYSQLALFELPFIIYFPQFEENQRMKVHKKYRNKLARENNELKTAKLIEAQLQKQIFFSQLITKLEVQLPREHLELFLQYIDNTTVRQKKGKNHQAEDSIIPPLPNLQLNKNTHNLDGNSQNDFNFKKIDTNVFHFSNNKPFPYKAFNEHSEMKIKVSTPKLEQTSVRKHFINEKLFDMDAKMKRNYERVKQRLLFSSRQKTNIQLHYNRASLLIDRANKTQRGVRYKTQALQRQNSVQDKFIPHMLMGELLNRQIPKKQKRLNTCQDRKIQYFVNTTYTSQKQKMIKYKINQ